MGVTPGSALIKRGRADSDGKGADKNVVGLPTPAIDARSVTQLLRNVGFDVVEGANCTRDRMTKRLPQFGGLRLFAVACRHCVRWRGDPGLKAVAGTPICEQQMGQMGA